MDKAALLADFRSRVEEFERYRAFIEKAQGQASKFSSAVVEKVIQDNTAKSLAVVEAIIPLIGDIESIVADLVASRDRVVNGRQTSQFALEELELRMAIGELTDDEFGGLAAEHQAVLGSIDQRVAEIDEQSRKFTEVLDRWTDLGTRAGVLRAAPVVESVVEEAEVDDDLEEPEVDDDDADEDDQVDVDDDAPAASGRPAGEGVHAELVHIADDLSSVFSEDDVEEGDERDEDPVSASDDPSDEADESEEDDGSGPMVSEGGDVDIFGDDDVAQGGQAAQEENRRAVLLYQEGTAEEQIYPFSGDVMTLGRGRDNDIQVKNDSKVSRYHCKLYRRGPNFYIEDNKSANGSLVNGELITERRLFGGEEIIIGETFFRFRIMD